MVFKKFLASTLSLFSICAPAFAQGRTTTFGGNAKDGNKVVSASILESTQIQKNYENITVNAGKAWVLHSGTQLNATGAVNINGAIVVYKDFLGGGPGEAGMGPGGGGGGADGDHLKGDGGGGGGGFGGRGGDGGNGHDFTSGIGGAGGNGIPLALTSWGGGGGGGGSEPNCDSYRYFGGRGRRHRHSGVDLDYAYYVISSGRFHFHRAWLVFYTPPGGDFTCDGTNHAGSGPGSIHVCAAGPINIASTGTFDATGGDGGPAVNSHEGGSGAGAGGGAYFFSQAGIVINGLLKLDGGDGGVSLGHAGNPGAGGAGAGMFFAPGGRTGSGTVSTHGGSAGTLTADGQQGSNGADSVENDIDGIPTLPLIADLDQHGGFYFSVSQFRAEKRYQTKAREAAEMMASFHPAAEFENLCYDYKFGEELDGSKVSEKVGNGDVCDAMAATADRS